jgi:3-deoxy-manno-octulosonate cytidylyltransferase (CMP-KDO synthetase)
MGFFLNFSLSCMYMNYKIVIPSRFGSSRLPGKPLKDINGKPMVWHVYQRALETKIGAEKIVVATDHQGIFDACTEFGIQVVMTREDHESGTDRLAEVADIMNWADDVMVVNLQGDEPLIPPALIAFTAKVLSESPQAGMATLGCPINDEADIHDVNCVKVVADYSGKAMYFSRAAIPFARDGFEAQTMQGAKSPWLRHIGMYAYRVATLKQLTALPMAVVEGLEKLEQLRALWNGVHIQVAAIESAPGHGIDTQADLDRVCQIMNQAKN